MALSTKQRDKLKTVLEQFVETNINASCHKSSGDSYHYLILLLMCKDNGVKVGTVHRFYDTEDTKKEAELTSRFFEILNLEKVELTKLEPEDKMSYHQNVRDSRSESLMPPGRWIWHYATTFVIARVSELLGRSEFQSYVRYLLEKRIEKVEEFNQVKKNAERALPKCNLSEIVFFFVRKAKNNKKQNGATVFDNLKEYLGKQVCTQNVGTYFGSWKGQEAYEKVQFLYTLILIANRSDHNSLRLFGLTSGITDVAAFIGFDVVCFHECANKLVLSDLRLIPQTSFMTVRTKRSLVEIGHMTPQKKKEKFSNLLSTGFEIQAHSFLNHDLLLNINEEKFEKFVSYYSRDTANQKFVPCLIEELSPFRAVLMGRLTGLYSIVSVEKHRNTEKIVFKNEEDGSELVSNKGELSPLLETIYKNHNSPENDVVAPIKKDEAEEVD